ncbi:unnamed protein product [Paramecium pentaurelia]|uniref:Uncharacterized protein n=1 Tax=Paramecium pentaurelia TaxID=43138 RepID=A0A8S1UDX2_9CILI|nr:unnamed protein product [Paramecium pentaurelia]
MNQFCQVEQNINKDILKQFEGQLRNYCKINVKNNQDHQTQLVSQELEIYIPSSNYKLLIKSEDVEIQNNLIDLSQAREFKQNIHKLNHKFCLNAYINRRYISNLIQKLSQL